jgi:hypothetical protein
VAGALPISGNRQVCGVRRQPSSACQQESAQALKYRGGGPPSALARP